MANIFDYIFNIKGDYSVKINGLTDSTAEFHAAVTKSQKILDGIGQACIGFESASNVIRNISGAFSGITEAGALAELQLMNLKTLFGGNAEAATDIYERISEYGKVTPYDKAGLLEAQRTMMSFGLSGEAAFETLKQIGDIAMGDRNKLQSLSLAFAQMSSTGKLTGQDLMQMINAGFNPLNEISKQTGKSVGELKEEMSKGAISTEMVSAAFKRATSEGGLFYGAIEAASNTTAGKMASIRDSIEEAKVSISNATGELGLWVTTLSEVMVPLSQLMPLIMGAGKAMLWVKGVQWAAMWSSVTTRIKSAIVGLVMYNQTLKAGIVVSGGFRANILQATFAVVRFATVGIMQGLKALGAFVLSLVTGGATSATFATVASGAFGAFKLAATTACRAVSVAIMNIPIIGWIAAAIAALIAIGAYFWNTSAKFRAVLKGLWASFKAVFTGIGEMAKQVFGGIGDLIKAAFSLDGDGIKAALNKMKGGFADYGSQVGKAFNDAYNAEMAASKEEQEKKEKEDDVLAGIPQVEIPETPVTPDPTAGTLGTVGTAPASTNDKIKNVTVNIEKLVERFEIHTTNLQGDISRVKDMVSEALLSALNDVNLAM